MIGFFVPESMRGMVAAKLWMIDNQNGRRNLTDGWKYQLSQAKKEILIEAGRDNLKTNVGGEHMGLSIVDKGTHNTPKPQENLLKRCQLLTTFRNTKCGKVLSAWLKIGDGESSCT